MTPQINPKFFQLDRMRHDKQATPDGLQGEHEEAASCEPRNACARSEDRNVVNATGDE